ncbi:MAG TPA: PAS-domain containing protein [Microvirga sp.]|jgi:PAS domain S-box-containing protein|nr:PAS-domain containing protein [Microvirga sp.]
MLDVSARAENVPTVLLAGLDLLLAGIGIFGGSQQLIYCNAAFGTLRGLPESLCQPGTALEDIVRYTATRGDYGPGEPESQVQIRMAEIKNHPVWEVEQEIPGGRRLLILHTPVPDQGLMITYTDVTEARATERKLRENEERYTLVSQAVAEGIYDWNIEQNTLFVSPRLMEIFGFEGVNLTSRDWFALVHEEDRELYRDALRECFRGRTARVDCEYRILVRSGEYRWVEDHGLPIRDGTGRAIRLVGAVSDVTQRKETERALKESEQRYDLALQATNESVYEWDVASGQMYYSPRLYAILGLTAEELRTAEDWLRRVHPEDLPTYSAATVAHLKGATKRLEIEYRYRRRDGAWHWARQHGIAQRDENGRAIRMIGSTGDITAEKQLAEELEKARRRLQDAIEAIAEGFVLFDPQDRIVMCNSQYRSLFHEVADQVRSGNSFGSVLRAAVERGMFPAAEPDPEAWLSSQLERRKRAAGPRETQMKGGIHLQVSDYRMNDGSLVSIYTDVSDLRRRQEELERAKAVAEAALEQLRAAQQQLIVREKLASLGQLTAGIAHEIKNPLNFVNNFAEVSAELVGELREMLAPEPLDETTRAEIEDLASMIKANLEKVVQHGRRADSIVKNMLLHSREGTGERSSVDLNATLEESLNLAYHGERAEKPDFNITVITDLDPAAGAVEVFPQEFIRVLLNLISNSFYAVHGKKAEHFDEAYEPTLSVATKGYDDRVEIRIRDNGTGIPDEVRAKMFNPFFTTKPAGEGTGLGLSLSYDIVVKQHGGQIGVDTLPGEFTEITVTLPRARGACKPQRDST